jgi:hypothetical protein
VLLYLCKGLDEMGLLDGFLQHKNRDELNGWDDALDSRHLRLGLDELPFGTGFYVKKCWRAYCKFHSSSLH